MTPITPMEAYATTDGKLHMDPLEAQAHQHGLDIGEEVDAFVGKDFMYRMNGWEKKMGIIEWEVSRKLKQLKEQNV
jgi:hypothetical protein